MDIDREVELRKLRIKTYLRIELITRNISNAVSEEDYKLALSRAALVVRMLLDYVGELEKELGLE